MEIKLEYLLDSGNTLRFRNNRTKYFRVLKNILLNIGPTLRYSIRNDTFLGLFLLRN